ncbi:circularly permuted type 2 ATP-grasp protein [Rhizobium halophytocola]|uniref:Circularly permuted ATP-grasp superfamily protein/putative alpha-E superfamily protein n=1 Tax=Rhizobium halophytocola TaxID=735519 RepID=A0ABS4DTE2_9HYPH|nr:circularly permuted type 2 ATP-grasp protein [Rhizobium halophytocola]MBP1848950.1 putative circularly permuted ATP-grasp superfamily protein/putative alpha-E superfamily protein [Rhizobium halophytocola]
MVDASVKEASPQAAAGGALGAAHYRALPGVADEMLDAEGRIRPVWQKFVAAIDAMSEQELHERFSRADRYLRDAGVFYRAYDASESSERPWPFSPIPVLIAEKEWQALEAGLVQRANLLEAIVADIYGDNKLVEQGILPAALIASNPEFLRPLVGVKPVGGHHLHFCSFEIGRGPDGDWWVLADRTQAPSGAGFALENRVATARAFSDIYADTHVHRLASFFTAFRDALQSHKQHPDDRIAVLTPGLANETYYEHAYIARYLGFMLLEGEDLAVVNNRLMVRTVAGLKPIGVLWRRLDASYADPLELNQLSHIGTPGFTQALRSGTVTVVNALGSGILETRALLAFLPTICHDLFGEELALPSVATWWCGQDSEREHVSRNIDRMVIGPAYSRLPFFDDNGRSVLGSALRTTAQESVAKWLDTDGHALVGQEVVTLSTTPVYDNGKLVPRPMSLRVYAARTKDGWQIMPGGFARIGSSNDVAAIAMQRGGSAADVWIVSDKPVDRTTLLQTNDAFTRNLPGSLPSRAADNLYWLGRYIERAEGTLRILRAWHSRYAETANREEPLLANVSLYLDDLGVDMEDGKGVPDSLMRDIDSAVYSASRIRDRFSPDGWLALKDLAKTARRLHERVKAGDDAAHAMTVLLRKLAGFAGLLHENMYRFTGWRFLSLGRYVERSMHLTRLLGHLLGEDAPDGALDMLLEIADSVMTHRRRYNVNTAHLTVTDLLVLDGLNPRSILFQLTAIKNQVEELPNAFENGQMSPFYREAMKLHSNVAVMVPEDITAAVYKSIEEELDKLSDLLSRTYLS